MLKTARKYGTNLAAIRISPHLKKQLPAFYHLLAAHRTTNNRQSKCLLEKHEVNTVADLMRTAARLEHNNESEHRNSPFCICPPCKADQERGCYNPHDCALEAQARIHQIQPKLNPGQREQQDNLSLTVNRRRRNKVAKQRNEKITFDPTLTCKEDLSECFRIFVDPRHLSPNLAERNGRIGRNPVCQECTVYTDGACLNNGKANATCGSRIWFSNNNPNNKALRIPGETQSNQVGEIAAVIEAVATIPKSQPLTIATDSKYVIEGLTTNLNEWENRGWIGIKNAPYFKKAVALLCQRTATTYLLWTKGHSGVEGNEQSDRLAKEGAQKPQADALDLETPDEWNLQGAKLTTLTQALAYRGIRRTKPTTPHPTTERNLELTRQAIHHFTNKMETDETIWINLRQAVFRTRVKQFLYKTMHNIYKVGSYWINIPNNEHCHPCQRCGATESMAHILTECDNPHRRLIWDLAAETWPHGRLLWPEINLGMILGAGCLKIKRQRAENIRHKNATNKGATRLLHILISEAAHLIWVLRCERVIREVMHGDDKIRPRWLKSINDRLMDDRTTASMNKRDKGFIKLVTNTWRKVLDKITDTPNNDLLHSEVLVGIRQRPPDTTGGT
jgi:ribonuclease HI